MDPHLTAACDLAITLDIDPALLQPLQDIQHTYPRRLLGLNLNSTLAFLYSETSVPPLSYRRMLLALRYLLYLLALPPKSLCFFSSSRVHHYARKYHALEILLLFGRVVLSIHLNGTHWK